MAIIVCIEKCEIYEDGAVPGVLKYFGIFTGARVTVSSLTGNTYQWLVTPGGLGYRWTGASGNRTLSFACLRGG